MRRKRAEELIREHIENTHASTWGEVREVAKPPEMNWMVNWFVEQCVKAGIVKEDKPEPVVRNRFYYDPFARTGPIVPPISIPNGYHVESSANGIRVRNAETGEWGEYLWDEMSQSYILQGKSDSPS